MTREDRWLIAGAVLLSAAVATPWSLPLLVTAILFFRLGKRRGRKEADALREEG